MRADQASGLTADGWAAATAHGVRTVVDLRDADERGTDRAPRPAAITTRHRALEDDLDRDFVDAWMGEGWDATPLYVPVFLDRYPERVAAALAAVADAPPGGLLVHCALGRDRTGLVSLLLLRLAGVPEDVVVDDYLASDARLTHASDPEHRGVGPVVTDLLAARGTTSRDAMVEVLASLDVEDRLRAGGLGTAELDALRARLAGP